MLPAVLLVFCIALPAQEEQNSKPEPHLANWYKIEVTLSELDGGRKTNTRSYTLNAEENGREAILKLGDRVPIPTGPKASREDLKGLVNTQFTYIDVGLNISCYVRERQGRIGLTLTADQSGITVPASTVDAAPDRPVIRQLRMENTAFVTLGKPILVATVDDPAKANHRYTVEATVTKQNP
jgi:hypothetical protein